MKLINAGLDFELSEKETQGLCSNVTTEFIALPTINSLIWPGAD